MASQRSDDSSDLFQGQSMNSCLWSLDVPAESWASEVCGKALSSANDVSAAYDI